MTRAPIPTISQHDILVTALYFGPASPEHLTPLVRALAHQTLPAWELCVVSSEAPEHLAVLVTQLANDADNRRVFHATPDLDAAVLAPFVAVFDDTSVPAPTFLEKAVWCLSTNTQFAACNAEHVQADGSPIAQSGSFLQGAEILLSPTVRPAFVIRRDTLHELGGFATHFEHDHIWWDVLLRLAARGQWGFTIPEALLVRTANREADTAPPSPAIPHSPAADFDARLVAYRTQLVAAFPAVQTLGDLQPYEHLRDDVPVQYCIPRPEGTRRLLIIMPWLIVGGAERVNLDLVRYLVTQNYEISFATTLLGIEQSWLKEFQKYSRAIYVLDRFLRPVDFARFLVGHIESAQIDTVMVSNSYLGYQLLPFLRAHCPDVTYVDYCHSGDERWNNGGYPRCGAAYQDVLDLNITSSERVKQWMVSRAARPERIQVAYTNVDIQHWQPDAAARARVRAELGLSEQQTLIAFLGRISGEKRPEFMADILAQLQRTRPGCFRCVILGDGPLRDVLARRITALQLDGPVLLKGRLDDAGIRAHLAAADVLLLPSEVEGISVAIFEAMACATIPVSVDVGGQSELVTPETGFLVPHGPHELDHYVDALQTIVDNAELRRTMAEAARDRVVAKFPLSQFGPRMAELFDEADALRRTAPRLPISIGLGREHAVQALELLRVEGALHYVWADRARLQEAHAAHSPGSNARTFRQVSRRAAARAYHWGVAHGAPWLLPLRARIRRWSQGKI